MHPDRRPHVPPPKYNPPRWVIDTGELVYYGTLALCAFTALFGLAVLVGPALLASGSEDPGHASGDIVFLLDVCLVLMAALAGGLAARALRLPVLVGYLLAGVVVGPHTPGFTADERTVRAIADLGVALLMFAVGVQFSLGELAHVRRIAVLGGGIQIGGTVLLGLLVALFLGWGLYGGLFLGCALALSSTAVIMRVLEERGEMGSTHGAALLGVSVVQDLSLVLMVALLPALAHLSPSTLPVLGVTLLKTVLFLGVALLLAVQGIPRLLAHAARARSPELFLLMTVCLCLAAAAGAHLIGLSLALGAFIAGIVISESEYAFEVIAQVRPLRDLFASLFFVSIGMLLDPGFVAGHWPAILAVVLVVVVGKFLLGAVGVYLAGGHARTALLVGAGLAQIGEFSFVLAEMGRSRNLIAPEIGGVILAGALLTVLVAPFLFGAAGPLFDALSAWPAFSRLLRARGPAPPPPHDSPEEQGLPRAVVLGYGRVGHAVSDALLEQGVWHVVVDYDPAAIAKLRDWGVPVVYGDASSEPVLAQALSPGVEIAVVALPEAATTERAVRTLRRLAPDLRILARVHVDEEIPRLQAAGASGVVYGEFETGTEMIRESLGFLGVEATTVDRYIGELRAGVVSEWDDRNARAAS